MSCAALGKPIRDAALSAMEMGQIAAVSLVALPHTHVALSDICIPSNGVTNTGPICTGLRGIAAKIVHRTDGLRKTNAWRDGGRSILVQCYGRP